MLKLYICTAYEGSCSTTSFFVVLAKSKDDASNLIKAKYNKDEYDLEYWQFLQENLEFKEYSVENELLLNYVFD